MSGITKIRTRAHRNSERGQAAIFVVLALGIFLIGGVGFVVDGTNLWFHRQTAQTAADAACTAGAMDLLSIAAGANLPSSAPTDSASSYATRNGYSGSGSNSVQVTLLGPGSISVAPTCSGGTPPPQSCTADDFATTPYVRVKVADNVPTTFMRLVGAGASVGVPAQSTCGLSNVLSPVPILVLNPNAAGGGATNTLVANAGFTLTVLNGPKKSIQVNSNDPAAVSLSSATIDLSEAGNGGGGDFAVAGRELQSTAGGTLTGGQWVNAAGITSDAFASVPDPWSTATAPTQAPSPAVTYNVANCSTIPTVPCDHYYPGYYPSGITVQAGDANGASGLAVFEPGIYYLNGDFVADTGSCLRPGDNTQSIEGALFYFRGDHTLRVTPNSGQLTETRRRRRGGTVTIFDCQTTTVALSGMPCISDLPSAAASVGGNVLLGPCTGPYGDPTGAGEQRGMLFFQDREAVSASPTWNPAGSFALVGNLYFHDCQSTSGTGSGANCAPSAFTDTLTLGSGANAYIVGDIVADQLSLLGNSNITVSLNPNPQYYVLKASLLQ